MMMGAVEWGLLVANALGFALAVLHAFLRGKKAYGAVGGALIAVAMLGGAWGVLLGRLLLEREARKDNLTVYVLTICACLAQITVYLMLKRGGAHAWSFAFGRFFDAHPVLAIYLCAINAVTMIAFGMDKLNAIHNRRRVRIVTLLGLALAGGSVGALAGMYMFRHKTRKPYFAWGVPAMLATQILLIFFWMNIG